jgi:epsilon-lactone hydrolase
MSMTAAFTRWLSLRAYGVVTSTLFRATTPPEIMRRRFERFGASPRPALLRRHPALVFADHDVGGLEIESIRATAAPRCTILYLHGGAYVMGSPASYRTRALRLSYRCNADVLVPAYRLAPEHPFPAALDDALVAWRYLQSLRGGMPSFVAGDSAGGGLALSLMVRLRELGETLPDGAVALSPWTDLSDAGAADHHRDLWLSRTHLNRWARYYVGHTDPRDPRVSPAFADLTGLPPTLVLVGEDELLAGGARRLVARARASGTDARLLVGKRMQHDWPLTLPWLDESRRAWRAIASFIADPTRDHAASRIARTAEAPMPARPCRVPARNVFFALVLAVGAANPDDTRTAERPLAANRLAANRLAASAALGDTTSAAVVSSASPDECR